MYQYKRSKVEGLVMSLQKLLSYIKQIRTNKTQKGLCNTDMLHNITQLPNRHPLIEQFSSSIENSIDEQMNISLLIVEVDRLRIVNHTLGYELGDLLLEQTLIRLLTLCDQTTELYRFTGDSFVFLLKEYSDIRKESIMLANTIIYLLQDPFLIDMFELHVSMNIGIAIYPVDGINIDELAMNADIAIRAAKQSISDKYAFYSSTMKDTAFELLILENNLKNAIIDEQFVLYYQPKIQISTGKIVGAEALLRWNHPDFGIISPGKFIPLAEEMGLIIDMDRWALYQACLQNKMWQIKGYHPLQISVNLSSAQFQQSNIVNIIKETLKSTELESKYLDIEITESTVMNDPINAVEKLKKLKALGVEVSIDDFGVAYSSLSQLRILPLNTLKIDKSFIDDILTDLNAAAITKAIINLGHNLNLSIVAEGVENPEQLEFLRMEKCDEVQGYLFSPPISSEKFESLLINELKINNNHKKTER